MRLTISIVLGILATIGVLLMVGEVFGFIFNFPGMKIAGGTLLGLVGAYLVFSFGTIEAEEVGVLLLFRRPIQDLGSGLYFAPPGIFSVRKELGTIFQDELPADPEFVYQGDGNAPKGMFSPIRVKFGQPDPLDLTLKDDPYNVAMVVEVTPVVSWHIASLVKFLMVLRDVENCRKILSDKSVEMFGNEFANVTPAKATLTLGATSQRLETKLRSEMQNTGIDVDDAYVKPFQFSHELNKAVVGVSTAQQNALSVVHEADGKAKAVILGADAEKGRLLKTGLARANATGDITELIPDATTQAQTDALKKLSEIKGTLVLGEATTMLGIGNKEDK